MLKLIAYINKNQVKSVIRKLIDDGNYCFIGSSYLKIDENQDKPWFYRDNFGVIINLVHRKNDIDVLEMYCSCDKVENIIQIIRSFLSPRNKSGEWIITGQVYITEYHKNNPTVIINKFI